MEEEKAAAYYEELLRKGVNAAKYKQGLGFSISNSQPSPRKDEKLGLLSTFVKSSPSRTAALEKETRLDNIREKLKRKETVKTSPEWNSENVDSRADLDKTGVPTRPRSAASEDWTGKEEKGLESQQGRRLSRRLGSRSPRAASRLLESDSRIKSHRLTKHYTSSDEDSRESSGNGRREKSTGRKSRGRRSRSLSPFKDDKRSSRGSRRREDSRSPDRHGRSYRCDDHKFRGRSPARRREERRYDTRRSSGRVQEEDRSKRNKIQEAHVLLQPVAEKRDYSKLIPNFDSMTPAEKVKAKMKLQLSETVVKDQAKSTSQEWERFDFNSEAPLDDDAKLDYFGDGTGARDDTEFLKNTGTTFRSSANQVTREAEVKNQHDNAIFGPPQGLKIKGARPDVQPVLQTGSLDDDREILVGKIEVEHEESKPLFSSKKNTESVVSDKVIAMQQAGSWQDRARKLRETRAAQNF